MKFSNEHTPKPDRALALQTVPEQRDPITLPVTGELPLYLAESTLYRVGPGDYDVKHADGSPYSLTHWFDGLSTLHAFHIDASSNSVSYRSRSLTDSLQRTIRSTPRYKWNSMSMGPADPCRSLLSRFFSLWTSSPVDPETGTPYIPNVGVTVQTIPGKGVTVRTDANANLAIDEDSLEIDHFFKFDDLENSSLTGQFSSAHGHFDTGTAEFFNFICSLSGPGSPSYTVFKILPDKSVKSLAVIEEPLCYIHSFSLTENFLVLMFWPLRISSLRMLITRSIVDSSSFHPDIDTKFYVVSRHGDGVVATYSSPSFYCFHTINAFERGDDICIDMCRYDDGSIIRALSLDNMRSMSSISESTVTRYVLPNLSQAIADNLDVPRSAVMETLNASTMELPRVNPAFYRKEYRYVYGASGSQDGTFDVIAKVDVTSGERITWSGHRSVTGEPIFVANPDGVDEDDGCLLVVVLDAEVEKSSLVVLDAKSLTQIAGAQVPQIVPLGFHGMFRQKGIDFVNPSAGGHVSTETDVYTFLDLGGKEAFHSMHVCRVSTLEP